MPETLKKTSVKKPLLLLLMLLLIATFFFFDLQNVLNLENLKAQQQHFSDYYQQHQILTLSIFFLTYVAVTALSLPVATPLTLMGGALFGVATGSILISFASTLGATCAFWVSRFLFQDSIEKRFPTQTKKINAGIEKEGAFYLFSLRLVPLVPFFLLNLVMGLSKMASWKYYLTSQLGMLPATIVYVNAGTQLGQINNPADILSAELLLSFIALALFPFISKTLLNRWKTSRLLRAYSKPKKFDYNLIVIGAGAAGLVSTYIARAVRAKVLLIEKDKMGGDCLNTGCVPSKALIRSAKMVSYAKRGEEFGLKPHATDFRFSEVMQRVHNIIKKIEPHDSIERYQALGAEIKQGEAKISSPYTVEVNGKTFSARNIIIATGARPLVPNIAGLNKVDYLTSDTLWKITELPQRLLILGGGPISCELSQAFARLGSQVTQVQRSARLMRNEDVEVSELIEQKFKQEGIRVLTNHQIHSISQENGEKIALCQHKGKTVKIAFDQILVAYGRSANTDGFGLHELKIELADNGTIKTNGFLQTNIPTIYCAGDCTGPYQFTHTAAHQAWYSAVNSLFSGIKRFQVDYRVIPWATFVDPEVARVGLNEQEAKQQNIVYEVTRYELDDLDRAIADSETAGFVKILTPPNSDKILGVTIVGTHAGELISEYILAMKHNLGLNKILGTIHIYPTLSEANKYAAGIWKKNHAPEKVLNWLEKFHIWRLG
ncbi:MAG: FAD-dependent oxidoreductase [Gammaproteobacteria bacterium]|nr:FAD-dependent oxidoreductase [Gammaproteobacteria bacterium]